MNKHFLFGSKCGECVHYSLLRLKLFLSFSAKFWKAAVSFVMSLCVCLSFLLYGWKNSAPTERIFIIFDIRAVFENLFRKFKFLLQSGKNDGYTWRSNYIFDHIILSSSYNEIRRKGARKIKTHFMFNNPVLRKSCLLWDMWKYEIEPGRPQVTIWGKVIACW